MVVNEMINFLKIFFTGIYSIYKGMAVTLKSYFAPAVTLQYPIQKQPMKERFRGMVDLIPPDCVICYQCIKICPTAAIDLAHQQLPAPEKKKEITKFTFDAELCCFCGLCEEICPTDAMFLNKMYEVSTYSHGELKIDLMDPNKYKNFPKAEVSLPRKVKMAGAPEKPTVSS